MVDFNMTINTAQETNFELYGSLQWLHSMWKPYSFTKEYLTKAHAFQIHSFYTKRLMEATFFFMKTTFS